MNGDHSTPYLLSIEDHSDGGMIAQSVWLCYHERIFDMGHVMSSKLTEEDLIGFYRTELRVLAINTGSTISEDFLRVMTKRLAENDPDNPKHATSAAAVSHSNFIAAADTLRAAMTPYEEAIDEGLDASRDNPLEVFDVARAAIAPAVAKPRALRQP
jgi:hypothetical protein